MRQTDKPQTEAGADQRRPRYHFTPPSGWMNDPVGLFFSEGLYHLYYQHNPYAPEWGAMHWGHAVSRDLLHWQHLPIALAPSEPYDSWEAGGCFSGSTVLHGGLVYAFYTGVCGRDGQAYQTQCLAVSRDGGTTFEKHPANPLIQPPPGVDPAQFRDPKVWRQGDAWYMLLGARRAGRGELLLYRSADLLAWELVGPLALPDDDFGNMLECPDCFTLDGKDVLMFSPMGSESHKVVYLTGRLDCQKPAFEAGHVGETDWGFDYYATHSLKDGQGRRLVFAWANAWTWMPWWNNWGPAESWCGALAMPRQASLLPDGRLAFAPLEELARLRGPRQCFPIERLALGERRELSGVDGLCCELLLELDLARTTAQSLLLRLRSGQGCETLLRCNLAGHQLTFDRTRADAYGKGVRSCPLRAEGETLRLRVFIDCSSIEVFTDGDTAVMSGNVYAPEQACHIYLEAEQGEVVFAGVTGWDIK
ncbi:glycoside hydrolase family 32 protein [Ruminococcaceae bacterium OttesenSCG-928-A11]|nr:glycoside hydrolase family 32 protein [Ruminococcaceae bacterium OttesenSCG-928-A11]